MLAATLRRAVRRPPGPSLGRPGRASALVRSLSSGGGAAAPSGAAPDGDNLSAERHALFRPLYDEMARGKFISRGDLLFSMTLAVPDATVTDEQIDRMMRLADLDGNGRIDFEEFVVLFEDIGDDEISLTSLAQYWLGFSNGLSDPETIFLQAWDRIARRHGGEANVQLPREVLFLGGAPGAGKGTMTPYIMQERGLDASPVVLSNLLNSPAAKKIIDAGGLVSDMEVFSMLLQELARPEQTPGALVDGFPRTVVQVGLLQMLHNKMSELSRSSEGLVGSGLGSGGVGRDGAETTHPRPRFRMCILYVDEHESIQRQLSRGRKALEHNRLVEETGEGELEEVRETDLSVKSAKHRYRLFVDGTMEANDALKSSFPYNLINASGSIAEVRQVVMQELSYQSSLELGEDTYNSIKHIPTAAEITRHARQNLVGRLDGYRSQHRETFEAVVSVIEDEFLSAIQRHALVGEARVSHTSDVFTAPLAMDMAVDIMFDRGFALRVEERPPREGEEFHLYRFKITFQPPLLHNKASSGTELL